MEKVGKSMTLDAPDWMTVGCYVVSQPLNLVSVPYRARRANALTYVAFAVPPMRVGMQQVIRAWLSGKALLITRSGPEAKSVTLTPTSVSPPPSPCLGLPLLPSQTPDIKAASLISGGGGVGGAAACRTVSESSQSSPVMICGIS